MADDDHSGTKPAPVVLRIKLRYDDVETFVERFAVNIGRAGLFVHSKTPRPVGTEVKFEFRLADDKPILVGIGAVREAREPVPDRPRDPSGMMIAFTRVTRESRDLLLRVLEFRKRHQLADGVGGMPDIDAEREQSGLRPLPAPSQESSPVVVAVPTFESQPVAPPPPVTPAVAVDVAAAGIAAAAAAASVAAGPILPPPPPPLAPEPQRRARPRPQEVIAAAGAAIQTTTAAVEDTIDVARVLARARTIVTGNLDDELAALGGHHAPDGTPAPISPDEASNQLAAMLGVAVRRSAVSRPARAASERAFLERAAAEQAEADKAAAERAVAERAALERAQAEANAAAEREEAERRDAEKVRAERMAAQRAEADRLAAERAAAAERIAAERAHAQRVVAERADAMRAAAERAELEHAAAQARETERSAHAREAERAAAGREAARVAAVRAEAERADAERLAAEVGAEEAEREAADHVYRASSPLLSLDDDDESTAATAEPPLPPELVPEPMMLGNRRPATPVSDEDPGAEIARGFAGDGPAPAPPPIVPPHAFDDDPDTRYGSEIPGRARRWMPRLESDIELAIESALFETPDEPLAPTAAEPSAIEPAIPAIREGTQDAGFEILSEADALEAQAYGADPDRDAGAIPSAIPSESAYRPTAADELDAFDDPEGEPIHRMPTHARTPAPPPRVYGGEYSIQRARSDDGTVDLGRDDGFDPDPDPNPYYPPETLGPDEPPLILRPSTPELAEPLEPDDFRGFRPTYDATPEPIEDFADRLDLESRSVSLAVGYDRSDFSDLAGKRAPDESDLYIPAAALQSGERDADDMYGGSGLGYTTAANDDDLGELAEPPTPRHDDVPDEHRSAPYMTEPPPPPEVVWTGARRPAPERRSAPERRVKSPAGWDDSDVHEAEPPRASAAPAAHAAADDEIDLESALEELDVDLGGDPAPQKKKPSRAVTDDGIPIDFDDDD